MGFHTSWSTYGSVVAPVILGYGPNGQCPIWALVTQTVPVWVALWLGEGVASWTGARVGDRLCLRCGLTLCVRCGPALYVRSGAALCVRSGAVLCGADRPAGEDATVCCGEQPTA